MTMPSACPSGTSCPDDDSRALPCCALKAAISAAAERNGESSYCLPYSSRSVDPMSCGVGIGGACTTAWRPCAKAPHR